MNKRIQAIYEAIMGIEKPAPALEVLPGTPYSRFAIPVDYPPSRSFTPRYGYTHGLIHDLKQWFIAHAADYHAFLDYMRSMKVDHIPVSLSADAPLAPAWVGGPIAAFDSLALYAMVHKYQPKIYFEIGSGLSTCFAHQAIKDAGLETRIISIDPQPRREIDAICNEVIRAGLETCDLSVLDQLRSGDILFFDGSHRCFMNSDVTVFFIDILPRLHPGVIVHVHDIFLPWDYSAHMENWYWNEQYMLAVYLMSCKAKVVPLLPTAWVCRIPDFAEKLDKPFVDLGEAQNPGWRGGGSMWFKKTDW